MRIGIDFDDVISHTSEYLFQAVKEHLGKMEVTYEGSHYEWEETLSVSTETLMAAYRDVGLRHSFHQSIPQMVGCTEVIKKLKASDHKLYVISARGTWELPYSIVWLKDKGILPYLSGIIHRPVGTKSWEKYKLDQAHELAIDVFIEDAPKTAITLAKAGIPTILFDAQYNRELKLLKNMYRVKKWKEIPKIIKNLELRNDS